MKRKRKPATPAPSGEAQVTPQEQIEALTAALQGTMTLSIAYLPTGAMLTAAISAGDTAASLRATKIALQTVLVQIDERLLEMVVVEAQRAPAPAGEAPA